LPTRSQHPRAREYAETFAGQFITTAWVLTELADGLARPSLRRLFVELHDDLLRNPNVRIEPCTDQLLQAGIDFYRDRPDKAWSLTDCISFVVMQREGITEALTGDHDFEQAGFVALLK
jgi:predicted nucleic acid-binding protein